MTSPNTTSLLIDASMALIQCLQDVGVRHQFPEIELKCNELVQAIDAKRKAVSAAKKRMAHREKADAMKAMGMKRYRAENGAERWE